MSRIYLFQGSFVGRGGNKVAKKSVFSVYCTQIFLCSTEGVEGGVCVQWVAGGWGTGAGWDRKQVWVILGRGKQNNSSRHPVLNAYSV